MTDDQHGPGHGQDTGQEQSAPPGGGRWDPLPQGDYDDGATAFVKLPEGGIDALLAAHGADPLAAPGHGYVPPQIAVTPPPEDATAWAAPPGGTDWPAPQGTPQTVGDDRFSYQPGSTGQWSFGDNSAAAQGAPQPAPGHEVTGQWSIPVAGGDLPDESGEFTASALVEQWGGTPPATLPGGAPAPWATGATDTAGTADQSWGRPTDQADMAARPTTDTPPYGTAHPHTPAHGTGYAPEHDTPAADHDLRHPAQPDYAGHTERTGLGEHTGHTEHTSHTSHTGHHAHSAGAFAPDGRAAAPEVSAEAYTVSPNGPQEAARRAAEADAATEAAEGPDHAHEAAHGTVEPSAEPVEPAAAHGDPRDPADAPDAEPSEGGTAAEADAAADETPAAPVNPETPTVPAPAETAPETADAPADALSPFHDEHPLAAYALRVNGSDRPVTDAWIGESLLYVLRERLGLAGAKDGCSQGECGACNVQVDGRLVASCLVPAVTTAGSEIRTVEGLAVDGRPSDVQRALAKCGAVQCGFCVPGMAMTVHDLLEGNPAPTELETRQALCGNLCRCSGYRGVLRAVKDVVAEREAHAEAESIGDEARIPHQAGPGAGGVHASAFENPAQPHPHDPAYGQGQDGGQA